ncbi:hypothetical protein C0992_009188 [Termitomyces sp. T32_za158]|nr:hypothetical protein C0992_009188 [Termitomyces sp. T32_za158]
MSFTFNWPRFSDQFHYDAIQMLNTALNKGNKPPIIADRIEVVELEMGTQPPELEIRDIGDLTVDQFRGIFRLTYSGDAHLVLKTKVQANPLNHKQADIHLLGGSRGMLAAKQPLVVPMLLRLSHFKLNSYVVLVVSKQKGITLVFKTDPLQNVDINSTFDSIAVIQKFIQREIEGQLRQMFHLENFDPTYGLRPEGLPTKSAFSAFSSLFTASRGLADLAEEEEEEEDEEEEGEEEEDGDGETSFDMVNWEYTIPTSAPSIYDDAQESVLPDSEYETVPAVGGGTITRPRIYHSHSMIQTSAGPSNATASPSKHQHSYGSMALPRSGFTTPAPFSRHANSQSSYFGSSYGFNTAPPFGSMPGRPVTPDSLETQPSTSSSGRVLTTSTPPTEHPPHEDDYPASPHDPGMYLRSPHRPLSTAGPSSRRPSVSVSSTFDNFDTFDDISPSTSPSHHAKIVLRPSLNNNITQLSTLSYSNHTLSPYTRNLQHFTVRSVPPRSAVPCGFAALDRQPIKAKRKRTFHLGGVKKSFSEHEAEPCKPKKPPNNKEAEFDASDMDRYFKSHDDHSVDLNAPHITPPPSITGRLSPIITQP